MFECLLDLGSNAPNIWQLNKRMLHFCSETRIIKMERKRTNVIPFPRCDIVIADLKTVTMVEQLFQQI